MNKYLAIACVILGIACATLFGTVKSLRQEKSRLANNQQALLEEVSFYQTEAGKSAASVQSLELTKSELEQHCNDLIKTVEDLNIKLKRVEAAAATATKTEVKIQTIVRDSIVYRDTTMLRLQTIKWKDPWVEVAGLIYPNKELDMKVSSVDTLHQIVHRVPKQFLFFKWGTKAIRQEIVSSNPHTTIVYSEYIELSKKRKKK